MTEQTAASAAEQAPVPGSPEYDAAMLAVKAAAREETHNPYGNLTDGAEKPVRPDHVPEKFWNAETGQVDVDGLLKSYTELESGRGKKAEEGELPNVDPEVDAQAKDTVEKAGLNWDGLVGKIAATGDIEESDYEALEKNGVPRGLVEEVIELRKYRHEQEQLAAISYAGGEQAASDLMVWAGENLDEADKAAYQAMLDGPHWRVAIDALKARQASSSKTANEPKLVRPQTNVPNSTTGYTSREDMKADMRNPLYFDRTSKGEAFRAEVMRKASVSSWNRK